MDQKTIDEKLKTLDGWSYLPAKKSIQKEYLFKSYLKTIGFVNAIAWEANKQSHHPDLEVGFNRCLVLITTHDDGGISDKDFKLAKAIDALI